MNPNQDPGDFRLLQWLTRFYPRVKDQTLSGLRRGFGMVRLSEPNMLDLPITQGSEKRAVFDFGSRLRFIAGGGGFGGAGGGGGGGGPGGPGGGTTDGDDDVDGTNLPPTAGRSGSGSGFSGSGSGTTSGTGPSGSTDVDGDNIPDPAGCDGFGNCAPVNSGVVWFSCSFSGAPPCPATNGVAALCGQSCTAACYDGSQQWDCGNCDCGPGGVTQGECNPHSRICCYDDQSWSVFHGSCCICIR